MSTRRALAFGALLLAAAQAAAPSELRHESAAKLGEAIYLRGALASGAPLQGSRGARDSLGLRGADAACVNCHERSGLGTEEGNVQVPPVAGRYLFPSRATGRMSADLPYVSTVHPYRSPYTEATLARAIRAGLDSDGKPLSVLMPRFKIGDADMRALIAYLNSMEPRQVPGVTDTVLHFATIITPDADPVKRDGMLDVLEHFVAEKNDFPFSPSPHMRATGLGYYGKNLYRANRRWQLHVWQLKGAPATWRQQLVKDMMAEPVMAVISGLGRNVWGPVHDFCEQERVPCLFPNIEVPAVANGDFYSLYFSRGVLLEADLIAAGIAAPRPAGGIHSVLQIYRARDSGEQAAHALAGDLRRRGIEVHDRVLAAGPPGQGVAQALHAARPADALVLWLRPADVADLGDPAGAPSTVYLSGLMGGLEDAPLPRGWRSRTVLAYPLDLPQRRMVRLDFPLGWFSIRRIPIVAETVQVNTYVACGLLAETLNDMSDNLQREYLVEVLDRMLEHRYLTGYYPRLELAPGQSFASKGGYLVKFAASKGTTLLADGRWTVP